jgi:hypothetical protein
MMPGTGAGISRAKPLVMKLGVLRAFRSESIEGGGLHQSSRA